MGNIGTLALGALLILGVLFIGYKMDTASEKAPVRKKQQVPKTQKKSKVKEEYIEETLEDIYDLDIPYESEENEFFTNDSINKYEEDDISLFGASEDVEFTFDNDIDDEISFELDKKYEEEVVVPVKKSKKRKEKVEKDDFSSTMIFDSEKLNDNSEEIDKEAYIETMDHVDEMVAMLDEFGKTESLLEEPDDYTEAVYGIDEKLKELDEDIESNICRWANKTISR